MHTRSSNSHTRRKNWFCRVLTAVMGVVCLWALAPGLARADLTILPIRVVFEDRERAEDLTIINTSKTTNTYRLEWGYRRMKEEGGYEILDAPIDATFNPQESLIFSPRQVTIAPGETQRIRISLRRPADLPDGEYRAHLVLKKVAGGEARPINSGQSGIQMQLKTNVGFSVPVIVRQGVYDGSAKITEPRFMPPAKAGDKPRLEMTLVRTGKHSVTGNVRVLWTPPGGSEKEIGRLNNLNIFPEIERRVIGIPLSEGAVTSGTVRVIFEGTDKERGVVFDEQTFPVGG